MKKFEFIFEGFHGEHGLAIMVPDDTKDGDTIEVSPSVAKRLNNIVCGITGCRCRKVAISPDGEKWFVRLPK